MFGTGGSQLWKTSSGRGASTNSWTSSSANGSTRPHRGQRGHAIGEYTHQRRLRCIESAPRARPTHRRRSRNVLGHRRARRTGRGSSFCYMILLPVATRSLTGAHILRARGLRGVLRTSPQRLSEKFDKIFRDEPPVGMRHARTPGIMVTVRTDRER